MTTDHTESAPVVPPGLTFFPTSMAKPIPTGRKDLKRCEPANVPPNRAYRHQQHGEIGHAIALYRVSRHTSPPPVSLSLVGLGLGAHGAREEPNARKRSPAAAPTTHRSLEKSLGAAAQTSGRG